MSNSFGGLILSFLLTTAIGGLGLTALSNPPVQNSKVKKEVVNVYSYMNRQAVAGGQDKVFVALPVRPQDLKQMFEIVKKCDNQKKVCRPLVFQSAFLFSKSKKEISWIMFHHAPGFNTPEVVSDIHGGHNTLFWSCYMNSWDKALQSMHKPYLKGDGPQEFTELHHPGYSFKRNGKVYYWYEFRKQY